jgi:Fe-S cluster assembly protein SufD
VQRRRALDHRCGDPDRRRLERAIDFAPAPAVLAAAIAELEHAGSGGAVAAAVRERALNAFERFPAERTPLPPQWRHDYARLSFEGLHWSSGRVRVPAERTDGLAHAGSTLLDAPAAAARAGVTVAALADARRRSPERVAAVHLQIVAPQTDRFTALATAFQNCGVYVEVPAGVTVAEPLQLLWLGAPGEPAAVFPHTVIRVGAHARVTIVERRLGGQDAFVAGLVEAELEPGARLDYVAFQDADDGGRVFMRRRARCAAGATIAWHLADLGGAIARTACGAQLTAAGASAEANAFVFARGYTHAECIVEVDHDAARTESRTTVRRAVTDRGRGRFAGALRFAPAAAHTVAALRDDGLILARDAFLDSAPVLAVPAQHVAATQSSSIGSLDEDELFYVQSRGISRAVAERMIALAFFEPALSRFPTEALRDEIRSALDEHLDAVPGTFG